MNRLVAGIALGVSVIGVAGCYTSSPNAKQALTGLPTQINKIPEEYRETVTVQAIDRQVPKVCWGSYSADFAVAPYTQGPVDTYRPLYKVDDTKKISAKGEGFSEREAVLNAVYNGCTAENCDCIVAAQQIVRTFARSNRLAFEVVVTGYPARLTGVQTIKTAFYEEAQDGSLKKIDNPETRCVLKKDGSWKIYPLNSEHGISVKSPLVEKGMDMPAVDGNGAKIKPKSSGPKPVNGKQNPTSAKAE